MFFIFSMAFMICIYSTSVISILSPTSNIYQQVHCTKIRFSIKDFFSKCERICRKLQICSHLFKTCLTEKFIQCRAVIAQPTSFQTILSTAYNLLQETPIIHQLQPAFHTIKSFSPSSVNTFYTLSQFALSQALNIISYTYIIHPFHLIRTQIKLIFFSTRITLLYPSQTLFNFTLWPEETLP